MIGRPVVFTTLNDCFGVARHVTHTSSEEFDLRERCSRLVANDVLFDVVQTTSSDILEDLGHRLLV